DRRARPLVIPADDCHAFLEIEGLIESAPLTVGCLRGGGEPNSLTKGTGSEAILYGPGPIQLNASGETRLLNTEQLLGTKATVSVHLQPLWAERPIVLGNQLKYSYLEAERSQPSHRVHWSFKPIPKWALGRSSG